MRARMGRPRTDAGGSIRSSPIWDIFPQARILVTGVKTPTPRTQRQQVPLHPDFKNAILTGATARALGAR